MNIVEQLLQIDLGEIEIPKTVKKMYLKKIKKTFEFECVAIDTEKANEIQMMSFGIKGGDINEIDMFKLKVNTVIEGCICEGFGKIFRNKDLMKHFNSPVPTELVKKLLTDGELTELYTTITGLSSYDEAKEDEIKN